MNCKEHASQVWIVTFDAPHGCFSYLISTALPVSFKEAVAKAHPGYLRDSIAEGAELVRVTAKPIKREEDLPF